MNISMSGVTRILALLLLSQVACAQDEILLRWQVDSGSGANAGLRLLEMDIERWRQFFPLHGRAVYADATVVPLTGTCMVLLGGEYYCETDFWASGFAGFRIYNDQPGTNNNVAATRLLLLCSYDSAGNENGRAWGSLIGRGERVALPTRPPQNCDRPLPTSWISPVRLTLQIPQNCTQSFTIANTGEPGSSFGARVADDGALGGFLEVTNGGPFTTIVPGQPAQVSVRMHPHLVNGLTSEADLRLSVYTSPGDYYTGVMVLVRSANSVAQQLLGTWSGAWSGFTHSPNNPGEAKQVAAVGGSWTLGLTAADLNAGVVSGYLVWQGVDRYWTYSVGSNGRLENITARDFIPDRTLQFDGAKGVLSITGPQCNQFRVQVLGTRGAANPSDAFYGPDITLDVNVADGSLVGGGTFFTHPYNPANFQTFVSTGTFTGRMLP